MIVALERGTFLRVRFAGKDLISNRLDGGNTCSDISRPFKTRDLLRKKITIKNR